MTNLPSTSEQAKKSNKNFRFLSLSGTFLRESACIHISENQKLLIRERKEYSLTRPKFYLVLEVDGAETYVSSMFPSKTPHQYYADYLGTKYSLIFSDDSKVHVKARAAAG